ncbi:MAG TPA: hypothetical protein PLV06_06690 [Bacteroidales bacterium]|nr:hypothetical protein [Bacteroidales bacterium]HPR12052.1 hypothetical protein [Bacteroidales bacterium]HRW85928.1 hypothetical protein [Bacteroidales bacterium]
MKKTLLIVLIIVAVIIALPIINLLRWTFQAKKPIGVVVVDKTVPTLDRDKHKSFFWLMTNNRYVKKQNNSSYSFRKDYYGFYPTRPLKEKLWNNVRYDMTEAIQVLPAENDALYFTDTYGVFFSDWFPAISPPRRTRKLEGALNGMDNVLIKEMKDKNKLVILEYNTFDWPTGEYESFRLQERLGIEWEGWTGKYFTSLDTTSKDFPLWMTSMYRKQCKKPWSFTKPGIVLLKDKVIMVLEEGTHLNSAILQIKTDTAFAEKWNIAPVVAFDQWFDIIEPQNNTVISTFNLQTTALADSMLAAYGLSKTFPAVIRDPEAERTYYFSGDFCHVNIPYWTSRFTGVHKMKGLLYSKKPDDFRRFFWVYYKPLIEGIFNDYYSDLTSQ